jgi:hypothetical protein
MNYLFRPFLALTLLGLATGCTLSTLPTGTESTTTALPTETESTTTIPTTSTTTPTTTDGRPSALVAEFSRLEPLMPETLVTDFTLPEPLDENIAIEYRLDGVLLANHTLVYDFPANDVNGVLTVTLRLAGLSAERTYPVLFVLDPVAHSQYLIDLSFKTVDGLIKAALPGEIKSDFTLPDIDYEDASVSFTPSISRIYNDRFIFSFPVWDTAVTMTALISYHSEVRSPIA